MWETFTVSHYITIQALGGLQKMELLFAAGLGEACSYMTALRFDELHEAIFRQLPNNNSRISQSCA